jgi:hypothetical protein
MGIFNFIKSALGGNTDKEPQPIAQQKESAINYQAFIDKGYKEMLDKKIHYWWSVKANDLETYTNHIVPLTDKQKVHFMIWAAKEQSHYHATHKSYSSVDAPYQKIQIASAFSNHLLRSKLTLDEDDVDVLLETFYNHNKYHSNSLLHWPINLLVNQIEKQFSKTGLSPQLIAALKKLQHALQQKEEYYQQKEKQKIVELHAATTTDNKVKPTFFPAKDVFGNYANAAIEALDEKSQQQFFKIMLQAQKASSGKPSAKFLNEMHLLYKEFGADKYKALINDWMQFITAMKEVVETHTQQFNNRDYTYNVTEFIASINNDTIKGLIWSLVHFFDKSTLFTIAQLADRAYRKIPGKGPASAAIGNACLYVLANVKGMDGIGHLSRLRLRIKQASTQGIIEKYLTEAAKEQGVSLHDIEDMAVDDYGLVAGKREYELEGYKALIQITGVGKTSLQWFKPDGTEQKAVPTLVKDKQATKLKKIKETIKQIELTTTAQRDRLDRMFISNRSIKATDFETNYLQHGLMQYLAQKIIWTVEQSGNKVSVIYTTGQWVNNDNEVVPVAFTEEATVSLWHPVFSSVADIKNWRAFMLQHQIVQPLKQAYREVYLLTDAEVNTKSYSNRMAAHILKQHQLNSLAKTRGWSYALQGGWDGGGYNSNATHVLKEYNLRAEFWINELGDTDAMNDTGIWLYMATDQVRFTDITNNAVKDLIDIPAIVFSEVMRDVDLFVGVASVGNDPNWMDSGGLPATYNTYWQSYSFGDLTEIAKTRKSILENLLPRLKIAPLAHIKDKFLVVKGKIRTYKIHMGSTNILMEPNDQYLCIVPDRSKKENTETTFLPFEGDAGLSVILSKAMLLVDDDKITDPTITSQINRK